MSGHADRRDPLENASDIEIWGQACASEAGDDDAERLLAIAAYADNMADEDERQLVTGWLAEDSDIAADIAAARLAQGEPAPAADGVVQRAAALVQGSAAIIPFRPGRQNARVIGGWTGWGGLVAATVVASWLGFTLGVDTTRSWTQVRQSDDSFLSEMLDPSSGFLRDLSDGSQT